MINLQKRKIKIISIILLCIMLLIAVFPLFSSISEGFQSGSGTVAGSNSSLRPTLVPEPTELPSLEPEEPSDPEDSSELETPSEPETNVIKAGTYRFNDTLTEIDTAIEVNIPFYVNRSFEVDEENKIVTQTATPIVEHFTVISLSPKDPDNADTEFTISYGNYVEEETRVEIYATSFILQPWACLSFELGLSEFEGYELANGCGQVITVTEDTEVDEVFYNWFIVNASEARAIKGIWTLNEELTVSIPNINFVNFTSNSSSCIGLCYYEDMGTIGLYYIISDDIFLNDATELVSVYSTNSDGWEDENYRTIDFGETEQWIAVDVYDWLIANATIL